MPSFVLRSRDLQDEIKTKISIAVDGLHVAAYFGLRAAVATLLKNGLSPDPKDSNRQTPLSWATANGHKNVVKLLLDQDGVNPNS